MGTCGGRAVVHVLSEGEIAVGAAGSVPIDVRFITATSSDLDQLIHTGEFRRNRGSKSVSGWIESVRGD